MPTSRISLSRVAGTFTTGNASASFPGGPTGSSGSSGSTAPASSTPTAWEHVNLVAKLADLTDAHYSSLLTISALTELLIEKGILTRQELEAKSALLEQQLDATIAASLHPMA